MSGRADAAMRTADQRGRKLAGRTAVLWHDMKRNKLAYLFLAPFLICFFIFIVLPVLSASLLAFTRFNSIEAPVFVGLHNFKVMFTEDIVLMKHVISNTFFFAVFVGPAGYALQFMMAWLILQIPRRLRAIFTMAIYVPSIAGGVMMSVVWVIAFSGDRYGYLNQILLYLGFIDTPVAFTQSSGYLMGVMIFVTLWSSMGVGFLSLQAGMMTVDPQLYEAGKMDGIRNKIQEVWYITIPAMKPQMLFSAIMGIVGALKAGGIGVQLSGTNPTPNYAGQLLQNHIEDFGFIRFELGYATALSLMLLVLMYMINRVCFRLLGTKEDE
ncbi:carbohydrate ABC transporter permease [Paenibacillus sp. MBLB4367]|uniref:carbohydrate ABC transporter permease n=1 Tax=Paenibacillus sp. MBLB4367 TaxID=3384767 RepID=UPI0039084303